MKTRSAQYTIRILDTAVAMLLGLAILTIALSLKYYFTTVRPTNHTKILLTSEAKKLLNAEGEYAAPKDAWSNEMRYYRETNEEARKAKITSAGPDGQFDTEDDLSEEQIDLNK